ncbi:MAG TPA: 16S rRNA (guanine(527)-N(7))-methyltransferase RsmG [Rhizomicrobium sp.]|jgi:16S rRNA (guanine527-N7)-methyltransferase
MSGALPEFGPEQFAEAAGVSRETLGHLKLYIGVLREWNAQHNLVSAGSLADVWRRHVWDCAQLVRYVPADAKSLADLGAGAGFPGLVLAELLRGQVQVTLFDATAKKARFLEAAAAAMQLQVTVKNLRVEDAPVEKFDVITARAMAPLPKLLRYSQKFVGKNSICLFPKGQNVEAELTEARKHWKLEVRKHPSLSDPTGTILEIRELKYAHR